MLSLRFGCVLTIMELCRGNTHLDYNPVILHFSRVTRFITLLRHYSCGATYKGITVGIKRDVPTKIGTVQYACKKWQNGSIATTLKSIMRFCCNSGEDTIMVI